MSVKVFFFETSKSKIFKWIKWSGRTGLWNSAEYRRRVLENSDNFVDSARLLQLKSIDISSNEFFKASINRISFEVDESDSARSVILRISLRDRGNLAELEIVLLGAFELTASDFQNMFVDSEVLGFELCLDGNIIRLAFLFAGEDSAIILARNVHFNPSQKIMV